MINKIRIAVIININDFKQDTIFTYSRAKLRALLGFKCAIAFSCIQIDIASNNTENTFRIRTDNKINLTITINIDQRGTEQYAIINIARLD